MPNLLIIPSLDIIDGKALRTISNIPGINEKSYSYDPVTLGLIYRAENAKCLHIVDFDSSQKKIKTNYNLIEEICDSVIIPVQIAGGINTYEEAKTLFNLGVCRLIIGSMAYTNPKEFKKCIETFGPKRIAAAIDILNDKVIYNSRKDISDQNYMDVIKLYSTYGIERIVVSDIERNYNLSGPNLQLCQKIASETALKITYAGGISGVEDLTSLQKMQIIGVDSVIVGRALYENKFKCQKLWRLAENGIFN